MNNQQQRTLQSLCEKHNAIGAVVWYIGIRFYSKDGKLSKVYSRKGLGLEVGQVWINRNDFKANYRKVSKMIHPDVNKDKDWANRLMVFVNSNLIEGKNTPANSIGSPEWLARMHAEYLIFREKYGEIRI
jgi:hypothetical protein